MTPYNYGLWFIGYEGSSAKFFKHPTSQYDQWRVYYNGSLLYSIIILQNNKSYSVDIWICVPSTFHYIIGSINGKTKAELIDKAVTFIKSRIKEH